MEDRVGTFYVDLLSSNETMLTDKISNSHNPFDIAYIV